MQNLHRNVTECLSSYKNKFKRKKDPNKSKTCSIRRVSSCCCFRAGEEETTTLKLFQVNRSQPL